MKLHTFRFLSIALLAVLVLLWQYLASHYANTYLLPTPLIIWESFVKLYEQGIIITNIKDSLFRFCVGFTLGAICAILLGLIFGFYKHIEVLFDPILQFLKPISPIAWFPFIVLWLGIGDIPAIAIIFIAVFFPILSLCISGVRQINPDFIKMAKNFGASELRIFGSIIIPGAFLHISSGLKLAACVAWIHLVAGEMVGAQSGVGYMIINGRDFNDNAMVFVGIIIIGALGYLISLIFDIIERGIRCLLGGGI